MPPWDPHCRGTWRAYIGASLGPKPEETAIAVAPIGPGDRRRGVGFTILAIGFQALWLGLPAVFLSAALVLSLVLWLTTPWRIVPGLRLAAGLGVLVLLAHVAEEYLTGFAVALPALFGRAGWGAAQYLVFNGVWVLIFGAAAATVRAGRSLPVLVLLFLAVAGGVGNGLVHLLLVLQRGSYFPGAWTAPFCLAVGLWQLRTLYGRRADAVAHRREPMGGDLWEKS